MSHSTLTWFSSQFVPKHTDEWFVLAHKTGTTLYGLFKYDQQRNEFFSIGDTLVRRFPVTHVGYWAYVPPHIDFHEKLEKQSQTPTE